MLGPTTNPFQASDATPKDTPARIACPIADFFSLATTPNELNMAPKLGAEVLVKRSLPEC